MGIPKQAPSALLDHGTLRRRQSCSPAAGRYLVGVWRRWSAYSSRSPTRVPTLSFSWITTSLLGNRLRETVFIELFDDRPLTRDNFMAYVNSGRFDNSLMHRLAYEGSLPFVLQGGGYHPVFQTEPPPLNVSLNPDAEVDLDGNPATGNPTVNNEFTNSPFRSNLRGTLAMAKLDGDPDSATSEYFFNLKNNGGTAPERFGFSERRIHRFCPRCRRRNEPHRCL